MVFTSTVFVFVFLPLSMALFFAFPPRWRAWPLLAASAVFYAWGEPVLVLLILATGIVTYYLGKWLIRVEGSGRKALLTASIVIICIPLAVFKYAGFIADSLGFHGWASSVDFPLPIGVSFYTFMSIGYLVDIYRRVDEGAPRLLDFSGFLAMYPHLVAGPIVRWSHIGPQLAAPKFNPGMFGYGALRVGTGLFKKAVVADSIAPLADELWGTGGPSSVGAAWIAVLLYSAQIYLDFSAYSDIAIGLAAMMGIHFHENFRFPYLARSAREFWQRWHISLGSWFRDYIYIPMGGSRVRPLLLWRNLLVVWALTGLWHGAAWTFVLWGLYFGILIGLERFVWGAALERAPRALQHLYGVLVAVLGWVLFRAVDLGQAVTYYKTMFGFGGVALWDPSATFAVQRGWVLFLISVALSIGIAKRVMDGFRAQSMPPNTLDQGGHFDQDAQPPETMTVKTSVWMTTTTVVTLLIATAFLVAVSYSPFIYFRF